MANKYNNGLIYKLICNNSNITEIYIGSTCDYIKRNRSHKRSCNNQNDIKYNYKVYQYIRENGGWDNWSMVEICKYPCETEKELVDEEQRYYELMSSSLNIRNPSRSPKERYNKNKKEILTKQKEYYKNNKEEINERRKEYNKEWYQDNKEHALEVRKKWKQENKEYIDIQNQIYRDKNKATIQKSLMCGCGKVYTKQNIKRHEKTKHHLKYIENTF